MTEPASPRRRFARRQAMDDKSLNLWRQIEGARRIGKRQALHRGRPAAHPGAKVPQ